MYSVFRDNSFKKDYKRCFKRGYKLSLLNRVIFQLSETGKLPAKYKTHKLKGNYYGRTECHIKPDWQLIWRQDDNKKELYFERTGHAQRFVQITTEKTFQT